MAKIEKTIEKIVEGVVDKIMADPKVEEELDKAVKEILDDEELSNEMLEEFTNGRGDVDE